MGVFIKTSNNMTDYQIAKGPSSEGGGHPAYSSAPGVADGKFGPLEEEVASKTGIQ